MSAVAVVGALVASAGAATAVPVDTVGTAKLTICHQGSANMVDIEPSVKGVLNGHLSDDPTHHDDVIPPFAYQGVSCPGKNWDAQGQAVWAAGCDPEAVATSPTGDPTDSPTSTVPTSTAPSTDDPTDDPTDPTTAPATAPTDDPTAPTDDPTDDPTDPTTAPATAPTDDPTDRSDPPSTTAPVPTDPGTTPGNGPRQDASGEVIELGTAVLAAGGPEVSVVLAAPVAGGAVLADTGAEPGPPLAAAGALLVLGAAAVAASRRHRWRHSA